MSVALLRSLLTAAGDGAMLCLAYAGGYLIRFMETDGIISYFGWPFLALTTGCFWLVFYLFDLYAERPRAVGGRLLGRIILAVGAAAFLSTILNYIFFLFPVGRGVMVLANVLAAGLVFGWRTASSALWRRIRRPISTIILGTGAGAAAVAALLEGIGDYRLHGILVEAGGLPSRPAGPPSLPGIGTVRQLREVVGLYGVKIVVLAHREGLAAVTAEDVLFCRERRVELVEAEAFYQRVSGRIPIDLIPDERWFMNSKGFAGLGDPVGAKLKRLFDICGGALFLVLGLPLWPLAAAVIKIGSPGPIFYRQTRIGKNGKPILLIKFRTMIDHAETGEPRWAETNDARVTRAGRILRIFRVDEWPQLWNVLKGDMSLVGPRPERPEFVAELRQTIPFYSLRHLVKPGLTGWAQINQGYAASEADSRIKLEYDLYYISRVSFFFDLSILARTLGRIRLGAR